MKKICLLLAVMLSVFSCQKASTLSREVRFSLPFLSGDLTKADLAEIETALSAANPTTAPYNTIQSTSVEARHYTCRVGQSVTLPLDTYSVTGTYAPEVGLQKFRGLTIANEPTYVISETIVVTEDSDVFTLGAEYKCFALVLDKSVSKSYSLVNTGGALSPVSAYVTTGDVSVCFGVASSATGSYSLTVAPVDNVNYEPTTIGLGFGGGSGAVALEYGKWYSFSADAAITSSGNMGVNFPTWVNGN